MSANTTIDLEMLIALSHSSDDAIVAADEQHRIILFNAAACHLFGYSSHEAIGMDLSSLIPPSARHVHRNLVNSFGVGRTSWSRMSDRQDVSGLRSDGTTFPAAVQIMRSESQGSAFFAAIVRDAGSAQRAESLLRSTMEGTSSSTGKEFLTDSVRVLGRALGCQIAFISEPIPGDTGTYRAIAQWSKEVSQRIVDYRIAGTPCESAIATDLFVVSDNVPQRYPQDERLEKLGVRSFVSVRMTDSAGHYLAHLGLFGSDPCFLTPSETSVLRIFAARIGAELERLRSDEERGRLQDFGRNLLTNGPSGVGHVDIRKGSTWSNSQFTEIVGRSITDVLDAGWETLVHPDDLGPLNGGIQQLLSGSELLDLVVRVLQPNGSVKWIHLHATSSVGTDGKVAEIVVFVLDLSGERETQAKFQTLAHELDLRNAELELILKSFLDLAFRFKADGTCLDCWAGDPQVLLAPPDQLEGKNLRSFFEATIAEQFLAAISRTIKSREVTAVEYSVQIGDRTIFYEARFSHLHEDEVLVVTRDVTTVRNIENQLVHARTIQSLGRMAGGIAHDFNNVLHIIRGHAAALERGLDEPKTARASIDAIVKAVDRTSSLIDRLMVVSDTVPTSPSPTVVDDLLSSLGPALDELLPPRIELELVLSCGDTVVAIAGSQLERAVLNLATNARDVMSDGGSLRISSRKLADDGIVLIDVSDTGEGIPADILPKVFEPFFTTKPPGVGNGLGLATALDAITSAGGNLDVSSTLGKGTTFTISLATVEAGITRDDTIAVEPRGGHGVTVLLVEDEPEVRELCADSLRLAGFRVIESTDGEDAISLVSEGHEFSVLLTDVVMNEMSGADLAKSLFKSHPSVPVVFMSGYSADLLPTEILERSQLLRKPFSDAELHSAIEQALSSNDPEGAKNS